MRNSKAATGLQCIFMLGTSLYFFLLSPFSFWYNYIILFFTAIVFFILFSLNCYFSLQHLSCFILLLLLFVIWLFYFIFSQCFLFEANLIVHFVKAQEEKRRQSLLFLWVAHFNYFDLIKLASNLFLLFGLLDVVILSWEYKGNLKLGA